jgi:hypothetical protein
LITVTSTASTEGFRQDPARHTWLWSGGGMRSRASGASWLELRSEGVPEEPLFLPVRNDGEVRHTDAHGEKKASLSDQAVYKMVKGRHREARIKEVSS